MEPSIAPDDGAFEKEAWCPVSIDASPGCQLDTLVLNPRSMSLGNCSDDILLERRDILLSKRKRNESNECGTKEATGVEGSRECGVLL